FTTPQITTTTTYYLETFSASTNCKSQRTPVPLIIHIVGVPVVPQMYGCKDPTSIVLRPTPSGPIEGSIFRMYSAAVGGILLQEDATPPYEFPLTLTSATGNRTYYFEAIDPVTRCTSARVAVKPVLYVLDAPQAQTNVPPRCGEGTFTIRNLNFYTQSYRFALYTTPTGGTPLREYLDNPRQIVTPAVTTTTTFYLEGIDSLSNCPSVERTTIVARVLPLPSPPAATYTPICGAGSTIISVPIGTGNYVLYEQQVGGRPIANFTSTFLTPELFSDAVYWLEAIDPSTQCTSLRSRIYIRITPQPAPPLAQAVPRCSPGPFQIDVIMGNPPGDRVQLYTQPIGGTPIATVSTFPYTLITPPVTTTTTFYLESSDSSGVCISNTRTSIITPFSSRPARPTAEDFYRCGPGVATITVTPGFPTGSQVLLYTLPSGGQPIAQANPPFIITTPFLTTTATLYLAASLENRVDCSSDRLPITVHIQQAPGVPTAPTVISRCGPGVVTLTASMGFPAGEELRLYTSPLVATPLEVQNFAPYVFTLNADTTRSYYLEAYLSQGNCASQRRVEVVVRVLPLPAPPTAENVTICGGGSVTLTIRAGTPQGDITRIFTQSVGGAPLLSVTQALFTYTTPNLVTTTTYFLESASAEGCISIRRNPVIVKVSPIPDPPQVRGFSRCGAGTVTLTAQTSFAQATIAIYTVPQGGMPEASLSTPPYLFTLNITRTTSFYFETIDSQTQCRSQNRSGTLAEVLTQPVVVLPDSIIICRPQAVTLSPDVAGQPIISYDIYPSLNATLPIATLRQPPYTYTTPILNTSTTYYVQATASNGCTSLRQPIRVILRYALRPPQVQDVTICGPGVATFTVVDVDSTADKIALFTQPSGGPEVSSILGLPPYLLTTPLITQNSIFYIESSQTFSNCPSLRTPVRVNIASLPELPQISQTTFCSGSNEFILNLNNTTPNLRFLLYISANASEPISQDSTFPYALKLPALVQNTTFYIRTQIYPAGCERPDRMPVPITLNLTPGVPLVPVRMARCGPGVITITASMTSPIGQAIELYTSANATQPIDIRNGFPYTFTQNITTTTTYYLAALSTCGNCRSPLMPVIVEVQQPLPRYSVRPIENLLCAGSSLRFTIQPTPEINSVYLWQGPNGWSSTQPNPVINTVSSMHAGIYTVTISRTDTTCSAQRIVTDAVQIVALPVLPSVSDTILCQGGNIQISVNPEPGVIYSWTGPNGFSITNSTLLLSNVQPEQAGVYTLSAYNPNYPIACQQNSRNFRIDIQTRPSIELNARYTFCEGSEISLRVPTFPNVSYQWVSPSGLRYAGPLLFIPSATQTLNGVWRLEVKPIGCSLEVYNTIFHIETPLSSISIRNNSPLCEGQDLELSAPIFSGANYLWQGPQGFSSTFFRIQRNNATTEAAGEYTLTITPTACPATQVITSVIISPNVVPQLLSNMPVCSGATLRLTLQNVPIGVPILWQGRNYTNVTFTPELVLENITPQNSGEYQARFTLPGCGEKIATTQVNVLSSLATPTLQSNAPLCIGQRLELSVIPNYSQGTTFEWQTPQGNFITTNSTFIRENLQISDTGTYRVIISVTGCSSVSASTKVFIINSPNLNITTNAPICQGSPLILQAPSLPSGASIRWSGKGIEGSTRQQVIIPSAGIGENYALRVEWGIEGCAPTILRIQPQVQPLPQIVVSSQNATCGNNGKIIASVAGEQGNWTLQNLRGQILQEKVALSEVIFEGLAAGSYIVEYTQGVCKVTSSISIETAILAQPAVEIVSVTGRSITVRWSAIGENVSYHVVLIHENGRVIERNTTTNLQYTFENLLPATQYRIIVSASCQGQNNSQSALIEVRTLGICDAISEVRVTPRGNTGVILSWQPIAGAVCYHIRYGAPGTDTLNWISQMVPATTTPSFPILSLTPGVTYAFDLRVNCSICSGTQGSFSPWRERIFYTTPLRLAQNINNLKEEILAYPNPTFSKLYLEGVKKGSILQVTDITGKQVVPVMEVTEENNFAIDFSTLPGGWYIVQVNYDGKAQVLKIRKEE
ncbi:MAG: fibronectin type III domain-containing protein, partial [Bacteroidia bacterium]|nr:fibronectin type III domain-containing protein [Bacteroidia bacterium]MDW8159468.1 fibronectin type III domain-containing protein [Bacteroidia bacterium]